MNLIKKMGLLGLGITAPCVLAAPSADDLRASGATAGQLQQELQRQLPPLQNLPQPGPQVQKPIVREAPDNSVTVTVQGFKVEGNTVISTEDIQAVLAPWLGKTVTLSELENAANQVATLYQAKGRLVQVTLPPQKITDGIVTLKIIEAKLGAVKVESKEPVRFSDERVIGHVTSQQATGEIVSTSAIERAIYILNETPGVAVTTELEPGQSDGDVDIRVKLADTPWYRGKVEVNNYGNRATGIRQYNANLIFDNPGRFGDQMVFSVIKSEGSEYKQASYSLPLNLDGWRLGASTSSLNYENVGVFAYPAFAGAGYGTAKTHSVNTSYALLRSITTNANLTFSNDFKSYENKLKQTEDYSSVYTVRDHVFGASANHYDSFFGGGVTNVSLNRTIGKLNIDATKSQNYGVWTPNNYAKWNLTVSRNQQVIPDDVVLNVTFSAQRANVNLDSSQKFYLGGPYGVRGYPGSQGGGSEGSLMTLELQKQLPMKVVGSVFYDHGRITQYKTQEAYEALKGNTHADNTYVLRSVGAGVKYTDAGLTVSLMGGRKLGQNPLWDNNGKIINNDGRASRAYLWALANWAF